MAQKFTSLDEAANLLGVSKDRLTKLREAGKVRGYRDGASWKFRAEDIEKFAEQGVPQLDPGASDLSLGMDDDAEMPSPVTSGLDLDLADEEAAGPSSGLDLDLAEDDELLPGPASDLNLDDIDEPTVPANIEAEGDESIDLDSESIDLSDSILLSEMEIGTPSDRPPSTIIGKIELDPDGDLGISSPPKAKADGPKPKPPSDIISDELDALDMDPPGPSADFEGLEELEVDLEAESSRILSPEDLAKAKSAAAADKAATAAKKAAALSDLELAPTDSDPAIGTSDIGLGGDSIKTSSAALTGLSALELEDDDDEVLGEGSDVTLSSESSGINIISPSDSGLALDEVDLSGSAAMGSSLDLGNLDDDEVSLKPLGMDAGASDAGGAFQLTPLGEDGGDDEKDSSQVIALDDVSEEDTGGALLGSGFGGGDESLSEGFADVGLATGVVVQPTSDTPFSLFNVLSLSGCILMLTVCGMMMFDLLRNMWSWGEVASFNSTLLDVLKF